MGIELGKDSIDLGIVVKNGEVAMRFYRDTLGLEHIADTPMPGGGGTMHRLMCGTTVVKVIEFDQPPEAANLGGGPRAASGYRYWTITVKNIEALTAKCEAAGYKVPVALREIRRGVRISMIEDPDGNWVELVENN